MTSSLLSPSLTLSDGNRIPQLGFGVCAITQERTQDVVTIALETGYRHFDTATIYKNERQVGAALNESGITREDLFLTGKLWNTDQGFKTALEACERSLEIAGQEYFDLYLIHWAQPGLGKYRQSWDALIELRERGLVRSVGVSNFTTAQIDELAPSGVVPVVHQIELHPLLNQAEQRAENAERGILTEAWSPLGRGKDLGDDVVAQVARAHDVTPAQVVLAWHLALGNVVIPKSVTPGRITQNFAALELELSEAEIRELSSLPQGERLGADPAVGDVGAPEYSDRLSFSVWPT